MPFFSNALVPTLLLLLTLAVGSAGCSDTRRVADAGLGSDGDVARVDGGISTDAAVADGGSPVDAGDGLDGGPLVCGEGTADCDGDAVNGCEADLRSVATCGACETACPADWVCADSGECVDPREVPVPETLSLGRYHSCAVEAGEVLCWGDNSYRQLGDGTNVNRLSPVSVPGIDDARSVALGFYTTCVRRGAGPSGPVSCWGYGRTGELGNGLFSDGSEPQTVLDLTDAIQISGGNEHMCALRAGGEVRCWGGNEFGQIGDGTLTRRSRATAVDSISDAVSVAAGWRHSCAVHATGRVSCWGDNDWGQLGDGTLTASTTPVEVTGITDAVSVGAGRDHSCAVLSTGRVWCWGSDASESLGDVADGHRVPTPVQAVGLLDATHVVLGQWFTCAGTRSGAALCWGDNDQGQLGLDDTTDRDVPASLEALEDVATLAAGERHACALDRTAGLHCWGRNNDGELGTGDAAGTWVPLPVDR